jgi:hypothetical protein
MNGLRTNFEEVAKPPHIQAYNTSNQSIPNGATTQLSLQASYSVSDITLSGSLLTIVETGVYLAVVNIRWAANATGFRVIRLLVDSVLLEEGQVGPVDASWTRQSFAYPFSVSAAQNVKIELYQNSGGSLNCLAGSKVSLFMFSRL